MDLATVATLYRYNRWANEQVFTALARVSPADFVRDLGDFQGSLRDTITHIVWSEWIWLQRWKGVSDLVFQPADFAHVPAELVFSPLDFPAAESLRERLRSVEDETATFVQGLRADQLAAVMTYRTVTGESWPCPLWRQLYHAVNHSSYHRGQVAMTLRRLGYVPVPTDFVAYEGPEEGTGLAGL